MIMNLKTQNMINWYETLLVYVSMKEIKKQGKVLRYTFI